MENDVVCGMEIDPKEAAGTSSYQGETYYFCSRDCKDQFDENPAEFVGQESGGAMVD